MSDFQINDYLLSQKCNEIARDAFDVATEDGETDPDTIREAADEYIWQTIDGHEYVIYTHKALKVCADCNTSEGEQFIEDCGGFPEGETFDGMATKIAFGEMYRRAMETLEDLITEAEEAA